MTEEGDGAGEGRGLLRRGQWPHRGPAMPRADRTEWRDEVRGYSKTLTGQGDLAGKD